MHPSSPHAPARLKARATGAKSRPGYASDPLQALSAELHGKVAPGTPAALAHAAAQELQLRRPRRPASGRASFRHAPTR